MYCVKCGVELADSESKCPLCETPVYFPGLKKDAERPYPEFVRSKDKINPRGLYFISSILFLIAAIIPVVCDVSLNYRVTWSGFAAGGVVLAYVLFVLPKWFRRPSPAVFIPFDFFAIGLYLLYVNLVFEGKWFLSFAFPVTAFVALIVSAAVILIYYLRTGYLYIFGGASILTAVFVVFLEIMIHWNFGIKHPHLWSVYPFIALFLIGVMLIVIAIVRPFRESLRKIFAI